MSDFPLFIGKRGTLDTWEGLFYVKTKVYVYKFLSIFFVFFVGQPGTKLVCFFILFVY